MNPAAEGHREAQGAAGFLTAQAAAARLGIAERTIRRAIARGELRADKRGGIFQISPADLDRYQSTRARGGGAAQRNQPAAPETPARQPGVLSDPDQMPSQAPATENLVPIPLTTLIGREREIAALSAALYGQDRLLTLTGPGGVGKTRLAIAAVSGLSQDAAGTLCYVALSAISDHRLVAKAIARALNVHESGGESLETRLESALRDQRRLLLLDNFEQVIEAAPLVAGLLAACPHLKVLVTSRIRLRISGEREWPVSPLPLESEAAQLFVERARVVRADAVVTPEDEVAAESICQRLDGLPLAIELAAARVNALSVADLASRLEQRLPLLIGGPRDAPARLQTMRDAIAWSYDLLSAEERFLFRRLAVFVGGFTLDAGDGVAGCQGDRENVSPVTPSPRHPVTLDLIAALVDKSLLRAEVVPGGATRYGMLETIREFGLEQLASSVELAAVRQRHADWYGAFAEEAGPRAKQPGAAPWIEALEREHPNLQAALLWLQSQGDGLALVRMTGALWPFWHEHTYFAEGERWLAVALELGRTAPAADRIRALTGAGTLAWYQTRIEQAQHWHELALALAREIGDQAAEAFALINLSAPAVEFGDYDLAFDRLRDGLAAARGVNETEAASLALHNLGCLAHLRGDLSASVQHNDEALALALSEGWDWLVPSVLVNMGLATADLGDLDRAETLLRDGLRLGHARGNLWDVVTALEGLARVRARSGRAWQAATLFGTATALRYETGIPQSNSDRVLFEPVLNALEEALGTANFTAALAEGRGTTWQSAMDELLAVAETGQPVPRQEPRPDERHGLTPREQDILRLLAAGESNRTIGERLFISPTTVATHVANIYGKLGVNSRAQAVAYAHRHDLS